VISFAAGVDEDAIMEAALEAGAEDVISNDDGSVDIITAPEEFTSIKDALKGGGFEPDTDEITYNASTNAVLEQGDAEKLLRMVDMLEDLDDVQEVYTNAEISDEIMDTVG
jgi:transcriptional/translational regulatory protein YebC/TACO1